MKNLNNFILERLHLNKDTKLMPKIKINKIDLITQSKIANLFNSKPGEFSKHMAKMKYYKDKNSDPKRLVNSIKDISKLMNRWNAAIYLEWDDAIEVFGKAITERTDLTIENLHQYICSFSSWSSYKDHYDHYKELYNIDYEAN